MNKRRLYSLTRSSAFLWKSSLIAFILFVLIGSLLWLYGPRSESVSHKDLYLISSDENFEIAINSADYSQVLRLTLLGDSTFAEKLYALKYLANVNPDPDSNPVPASESIPNLNESEYQILIALSKAIRSIKTNQGGTGAEDLKNLAREQSPPPFSNFALSLYYSSLGETDQAIESAKNETRLHPNLDSRLLLIDLYLQHSRYQELENLQQDPEFHALFDPMLKRDIALERMDWPVLIETLLPAAYQDISPSMVFLALLTGLAWGSLVLRFGGTLSLKSLAFRFALPALLLGAASAHLTILAIYLQEEQFGLGQGSDLIGQVIYCVAGIGLREELLKLLCFVPLMPFLLKRRNEMEILIVASLVGLGFAVEENISYLQYSDGMDAFGRFITANFFHFALTGMCGLALAQAFMYGGSSINNAVSTFGIAVLSHGAYNSFIIVPELGEYSFASIIILILVAYQYFRWLRHLRSEWRDPISLSAHFTLGLLLIFGVSYILLSWSIGPLQAMQILGAEVLGLGLLLIMFFREIPEDID